MQTVAHSLFTYSYPGIDQVVPTKVEEAAEMVRSAAPRSLVIRGGGTKSSIGCRPTVPALLLATSGLTGILEYDPGELTLTARSGTSIAEIEYALTSRGQYMPFDPPFASAGATLGGSIAAGLSGPRRLRYGGIRDFVLGIEYLNANGELVHGGGKVVKNAAGYDLPKLFCGSLGTLGVLTQITIKVFPRPQSSQTALVGLKTAQAMQDAFIAIQRSSLEVSAADAWPSGLISNLAEISQPFTIAVCLQGASQSLEPRCKALQSLLPADSSIAILEGDSESALWSTLRDLRWLENAPTVLRLYSTPTRTAELDAILARHSAKRVFSLAGNICWAALSGDPAILNADLKSLGISGAVWRSASPSPEIIPTLLGGAMLRRVKAAFDPDNVFYPGRYAIG